MLKNPKSSKFPLQAAHCIENYNRVDLYVGLVQRPPGFYQFTTIITGRSNLLVHPDRNAAAYSYDVGLLRLEEAPEDLLDLDYVSLISLPTSEQSNIDLSGLMGLFSGFGRTNDSAVSLSPTLRFARAPIMTNSDCQSVFGSVIRTNTLCIDTVANGTSSCGGDSGKFEIC